MEIYGLAEAIECESAYAVAKKVEVSPPVVHEIFGQCLKFICKRDGEAEITKELDDKTKSKCESPLSHRNLGDKIKANSFYVLKQGIKAVKVKKVHFSGAHNAREFKTDSYTFAEIVKPFPAGMNFKLTLPKDSKYISPFKKLGK